MSDAVEILNTTEIENAIKDIVEGQVEISIDDRFTDSHIAYRANWNLKDAIDIAAADSNVNAAISNWIDSGMGPWSEGGNFMQEIARQVKAEYKNQVMMDDKTPAKMKDMESRLIRVEERRI